MAIARVGNNLVVNGGGGTTAVNPYVPTAGNLCIVVGYVSNAASLLTLTLTDSRGNSGTTSPVASADDASGPKNINVWVLPITTGGAGNLTVTASGSPGTFVGCDVFEYSGCDPNGTLDGTPTAAVHGLATTLTLGAVTIAGSATLLFSPSAWANNEATVSNSLSGASQFLLSFNSGLGWTFEAADSIGLAPGSYGNTKTGGTSAQSMGALIGILAAGTIPPVGSLAIAGNAPGMVSGRVLTPLVARVRRGFERLSSGLIVPKAPKIFLPAYS